MQNATDLAPQINLSGLISGLAPSDVDVDRVIVMSPSYMTDLAEILSHTSKETLQNYFSWKAVQALSSYIEADAVTPYKRFSNELQGKVWSLVYIVSFSSVLTVFRTQTQARNGGEPALVMLTMALAGY